MTAYLWQVFLVSLPLGTVCKAILPIWHNDSKVGPLSGIRRCFFTDIWTEIYALLRDLLHHASPGSLASRLALGSLQDDLSLLCYLLGGKEQAQPAKNPDGHLWSSTLKAVRLITRFCRKEKKFIHFHLAALHQVLNSLLLVSCTSG